MLTSFQCCCWGGWCYSYSQSFVGFYGGGCCWWWWGFLPSLEILDLFFNDEVQKCHDDEAWCRFFYIHCSRHLVDPFNLEIYSLQFWKVLLYYFFDNSFLFIFSMLSLWNLFWLRLNLLGEFSNYFIFSLSLFHFFLWEISSTLFSNFYSECF